MYDTTNGLFDRIYTGNHGHRLAHGGFVGVDGWIGGDLYDTGNDGDLISISPPLLLVTDILPLVLMDNNNNENDTTSSSSPQSSSSLPLITLAIARLGGFLEIGATADGSFAFECK
jgi:hypothetical protein